MSAVPPDLYLPQFNIEEEQDPDERLKTYARDHLILRDSEPLQPLFGNGRKLPA